MPRRIAQNVSLTPEHATFIAGQIASGRYDGVSAVERAALNALAQRAERPTMQHPTNADARRR